MAVDSAPDSDDLTSGATSEARLQAAAALRRLGNAFVAHQVDDDLLRQITSSIETITPTVEQAPARTHAFFAHDPVFLVERMQGGAGTVPNSVFPDCVVSGTANPMGMEAHLRRDGNEAVMGVTLGPAFEGAPGRAHGGVVAALIDETMGLALSAAGTVAFTGRLAITYRAPTPLGVPLTARARLAHRELPQDHHHGRAVQWPHPAGRGGGSLHCRRSVEVPRNGVSRPVEHSLPVWCCTAQTA